MTAQQTVGILGAGCGIPEGIRTNEDPLFAWLHAHNPPGKDLFTGFKLRRYLAEGQTLTDLMVIAAQQALDRAEVGAADIDVVLGYASVSEYITPNALAQVHGRLGLRKRAAVIPLNDDFTNLNSGIQLAHALVRAEQIKNALIVCGCNWTSYVNYHTPQSIGASDGAGAVVVGSLQREDQFAYVDSETEIETKFYGAMAMRADPLVLPPTAGTDDYEGAFTAPYFHIDATGMQAYVEFGTFAPPLVTARLLQRNGIPSSAVTVISHQPSGLLVQKWRELIQPGQYLNTLETFANMTLATMAVNLATCSEQIETDYLVLMGIGAQTQTTATLLKRNR